MPTADQSYDLIIVGAGPMGLAAACEADTQGMRYAILDKAGLCQSISEFAPRQSFYSPANEMEIGDIPFPMAGDEKPRREDTLAYYRVVAQHRKLQLHTWERVVGILPISNGGGFSVHTSQEPDHAWERQYQSRFVLLASGVWDNPRLLAVPGASLNKVAARYVDPTPYFGKRCLVVGGGNSAAEVAMALARAGAQTTLAMIEESLEACKLRPFVLRELLIMIDENQVALETGTRVIEIEPSAVTIDGPDGVSTLANDFVFTMIGNVPDHDLLQRAGIAIDPDDEKPVYDPDTFETTVAGLYVVGSITREAHIVNGRPRAVRIVRHLARLIGTR